MATVMLSCRTCNRICPTVQEFSVYWNGHRLPLSLSTASSLVPMHALDENSPSTVVVVGPRFKTCTVLVRVSIANPPPPSASRSLRPALLSAAHRPVAVPKGRRWNQSSTDLTATVKSLPLSGEERRVDEGVVACSEVQVDTFGRQSGFHLSPSLLHNIRCPFVALWPCVGSGFRSRGPPASTCSRLTTNPLCNTVGSAINGYVKLSIIPWIRIIILNCVQVQYAVWPLPANSSGLGLLHIQSVLLRKIYLQGLC